MQYAQLNEAMNVALQVTTNGNVAWADTHFCPASKLTPDEAIRFRVVPLTVTTPPAFNNITQALVRDGCELVAGSWQYKWRVDNLSAIDILAVKKALTPKAVTMRQARLALMADGKLATVNAAIAGMAGVQGEAARIEWEFSSEVKREQPLVLSMGQVLGLNAVQLDALFTTASGL